MPAPKPETRPRRGKLKVFLGMGRAAGKTSAMLAAARREQTAGRDVLIACLEASGRAAASPRAEGLPTVAEPSNFSRDRPAGGVDLAGVLARRPQLAAVDELAHSNGPASRHPKRYQDVLDLLDAGIDVFTTLNIQNVESCAEAVRQITGETARETVPDPVLEGAEFVLVDLPVGELLGRLAAGDAYAREAALAAQQNVFRPGSLSALRELTLRFVAEHVGRDVLASRRAAGFEEPWKSGRRFLVAVSPSTASGALVRWARRAAGETHAAWLAVCVQAGKPLSQDQQTRLTRHLTLAKELGAQVITTSDGDVLRGLLRIAREQNVTQIVVGKPAGWRALDLLRGGSLFNRLVRESGDIDVHAVKVEGPAQTAQTLRFPRLRLPLLRDLALVAGIVAGVTAVCEALKGSIGYQPLALVYLLGVVIASMFVGRGPALIGAVASALTLDYFFEPPPFSFLISGTGDVAVFCTYIIVALIVGNLTARLRERELAERRGERRATGLFLLARSLAKASHVDDLLAIITEEVGKSHHADVGVNLANDSPAAPLRPYSGGTWRLPEAEQDVAQWAFSHRQPAGQGTGTQPNAEGLHLPLLAGDRTLGVLSLRFNEPLPLTPDQRDLLDSFVRQIALALDRQRLRDAEQHAELVAESERLSKTLLNSISHEMRTPLAAITSAASALTDAPGQPLQQWRRDMTDEIQEAARRLNRLVGNLLEMTRVETGHVKPKLDWCDVADLVQVTLEDIRGEMARHPVAVDIPEGVPLVRMDFVLMQQVITNLLLNAAFHTPPGTSVWLTARTGAEELLLSVADDGPGLPAEALPLIFDKFYRAPSAPAGGTGLGLAIVKGFVEAHNGRVDAANRPEGGALFTVRIPLSRRKGDSPRAQPPAGPAPR